MSPLDPNILASPSTVIDSLTTIVTNWSHLVRGSRFQAPGYTLYLARLNFRVYSGTTLIRWTAGI